MGVRGGVVASSLSRAPDRPPGGCEAQDAGDGTPDVDRRPDPYDREVLPPPGILLVALLIALIVLVPARRLQLAGVSSRTIGLYAFGLWGLATLVAIRPGATRILIPILLVAYLAPFVAAPDAVARFLRRGRGGDGTGGGVGPDRPPMKNVTPTDDRPADG